LNATRKRKTGICGSCGDGKGNDVENWGGKVVKYMMDLKKKKDYIHAVILYVLVFNSFLIRLV